MNDFSTDPGTTDNAYAPPATDVRQSVPEGPGGRKLGPDEARRLYNHSRSIAALVFLWCLGLVLIVAIFIPNVLESTRQAGGNTEARTIFMAVFGIMGLLMLAGIVGCWMRTDWGRIVGFILCSLMLLNFWIGTLIGIFGLIALANGRKLFGPKRYTHRLLKDTVTAYRASARRRR